MNGARSLAAAAIVVLIAAGWLAVVPTPVGAWLAGWGGAGGDFAFTALIFVPLAGLASIAGWIAGISPGRLGKGVAAGAALGLVGLTLATGYAALAGTLESGAGGTIGPALGVGFVTIAVQVVAEEWLFRGLLQPLVARAIGPAAVVAVAIVFGVLHLLAGASGAIALLNLTLGGLLFGLLAWRGGGVGAPIAAHLAWNAAEQLVLGLDPNPGTGGFGALVDLDLVGAAAWGGSADGLNVSWAMTFALVAIVVPLGWRALRR